jgi:hypothetical protein
LRDFIEHTLDEIAIAAGPGVFFVFRNKDLEQQFLSRRYGHRAPTILSRGWIHDRPISVKKYSISGTRSRMRIANAELAIQTEEEKFHVDQMLIVQD